MKITGLHIGCILLLLLFGNNLSAQADKKLIEAGMQYRSGNYEKSLESLDDFILINSDLYIQKQVLMVENFIALHVSEDSIRKELIAIYKTDPNFNPQSLNTELSDAFTQRLKTLVVYPKLVASIEASLLYTIPLVQKVSSVCEECVVKDEYGYASFNSGIGFRLAYMFNKSIGGEIGLGINGAGYKRNIRGEYEQDPYEVEFTEDLLFLNVPVRIFKTRNEWTYKAGINYRYLLKSDASATLVNTTPYNENRQTTYEIPNSVNYRNRNLVFISLEINRTLLELKNRNWNISAGSEVQFGLNSLTRKENRLADINFVSDTYYTDDNLRLWFIGLRAALNFRAHHFIR